MFPTTKEGWERYRRAQNLLSWGLFDPDDTAEGIAEMVDECKREVAAR